MKPENKGNDLGREKIPARSFFRDAHGKHQRDQRSFIAGNGDSIFLSIKKLDALVDVMETDAG